MITSCTRARECRDISSLSTFESLFPLLLLLKPNRKWRTCSWFCRRSSSWETCASPRPASTRPPACQTRVCWRTVSPALGPQSQLSPTRGSSPGRPVAAAAPRNSVTRSAAVIRLSCGSSACWDTAIAHARREPDWPRAREHAHPRPIVDGPALILSVDTSLCTEGCYSFLAALLIGSKAHGVHAVSSGVAHRESFEGFRKVRRADV